MWASDSFQISAAALALLFRSYVTSLRRTVVKEASRRVTELYLRWQSAERYLGPSLDFIPFILIVSIVLFISGLTDSLVSVASSTAQTITDSRSTSFYALYAAAVVASICFLAVVIIVSYTVWHSLRYRTTSPFQSAISRSRETSGHMEEDETRQKEQAAVYRRLLVDTYDDATLDDACSALSNLTSTVDPLQTQVPESVMEEVTKALLFLLSPQASRRSIVTAAAFIGTETLTRLIPNSF
jgi:hypothetical protein